MIRSERLLLTLALWLLFPAHLCRAQAGLSESSLPSMHLPCVLVGSLVACLNLLPLPALYSAATSPALAASLSYSDLWGKEGERWAPSSRLPDFSFAGYHAGGKALTTVPITANVKNFGATGDGTTDDTAAFQQAIAATRNDALYIINMAPTWQGLVTKLSDQIFCGNMNQRLSCDESYLS